MSALRLAFAVLACVACTACAPRTSVASSAGPTVAIHVPGRPDAKATPGVISIEVDLNGAQSTTTTTTSEVSTSGASSRTAIVVDGQAIEVVGDELHAFGKRYGPLVAGTLVRVSASGATVDGRTIEALR